MRPFALVAVVAAHIALLMLLAAENRTVKRQASASKSQLVFVTQQRTRERMSVAPPLLIEPSLQLQDSPEPSLASPSFEPSTTPAAPIDWSREAELSVARQIEADEASRRLAEMFTRKPAGDADPMLRPVPEFGWSRTAIEPIQALPEGGFIVWLNERCGIVIGMLAMPFCGFGEIPVRGDLFEHMADAPRPGDWKD